MLAVKHPERITAIVVQSGNAYDRFLGYGSNPPLYPSWQEYSRKY